LAFGEIRFPSGVRTASPTGAPFSAISYDMVFFSNSFSIRVSSLSGAPSVRTQPPAADWPRQSFFIGHDGAVGQVDQIARQTIVDAFDFIHFLAAFLLFRNVLDRRSRIRLLDRIDAAGSTTFGRRRRLRGWRLGRGCLSQKRKTAE
jgi:hypothetical protein